MTPLFMHRAAIVLHVALILGIAGREATALGLLVAAVLCLPLPGILRGRTYTCAWASMLVGFYVAGYLAAGYARPEEKLTAFALATMAALDYVCLMMFVRFTARARAAARAVQTERSGDAAG
ncbi:MAG: DUF2069 domain-containing protein [Panacagrimonas sp.]